MKRTVAEKVIADSLDLAISDMARNTRLNPLPPDNLFEVSEVSVPITLSREIDTELKPKKARKLPKTRKTVSKSKISRKSSKISGFFTKRKASRETLKLSSGRKKLVSSGTRGKAARRNRGNFGNHFISAIVGFYNILKKRAISGFISFAMFAFVVATTYVTYAFIVSNDSDLISNVSQHIILPDNEQPKVYIIQSEKTDLFSNPLFTGIKVGDNVLTYPASGKVIIYRSSQDKIVNVVNTR